MNYLDWDKLYQIGRMNWESSDLSYAIINLLEGDRAPSPGSLAVLGCGRGHDAVLFSDYGFDVVGFDFAPTAIASARELAKTKQQPVKFFEYDVFQLPKHFKCSFDYILDKSFFCTLPKTQHQRYITLLTSLLRPQGQVIALFLTHPKKRCPPFPTSMPEIERTFGRSFNVVSTTAVNPTASHPSGLYTLVQLERR